MLNSPFTNIINTANAHRNIIRTSITHGTELTTSIRQLPMLTYTMLPLTAQSKYTANLGMVQ